MESETGRVAMRGDGMQDVPPCGRCRKRLRRRQGRHGGGQTERAAACVCCRGGGFVGIVWRENDLCESAIAVAEDDGFRTARRDPLHQWCQQGRRQGHEQPRQDGGLESRWAPSEVHGRLVVGRACLGTRLCINMPTIRRRSRKFLQLNCFGSNVKDFDATGGLHPKPMGWRVVEPPLC